MRRLRLVLSIKAFAEWLGALIAPYDPILRLVSYVLSPILTIYAFIRNERHKAELVEKTEVLSTAKANLAHAEALVDQRQKEISDATAELEIKRAEIEKLRQDLRDITGDELWKLRPAKPFTDYSKWLRDPAGAKLITFGNLKGGVGKTTLAANFAAFLNVKKNKPVLFVDLDYQGSLSNMMMMANDMVEAELGLDSLFDVKADLATLDHAAVHLIPTLSQSWLVPANYLFAKVENQLLLHWLLQEDGGLDVRYRLAHVLLRPDVRRKYAAIILDMPPRMAMGAINALVASHYFVVPTVLDRLSAEAVGTFLTSMKVIKSELNLDIDLAGIAGVMTRSSDKLSDTEVAALERAREGGQIWRQDRDYVFKNNLPRRVSIANAVGDSVAYFGKDSGGQPLANLFNPLFEEICTAVWKGDGP